MNSANNPAIDIGMVVDGSNVRYMKGNFNKFQSIIKNYIPG